MSDEVRSIHDLEQPEQLAHVRWEWYVERAAWLLGAILLIAGVLGLFGQGPLTWSEAANRDASLVVRYYSVDRYSSDTELRLVVDHSDQQTVRVRIDRSFLNVTTPQGIWPPPIATETSGDSLVFTFQLGKTIPEREIVYHYKHETYGKVRFNVSVEGGEPVTVSQFVFP